MDESRGSPVMQLKENTGRVALITGSTSGIGLAIARQLAKDGFSIVFHSKSSVEAGQQLAGDHPGSRYVQADLEKQEDIKCLVTEVLSQYGRLDVLVNNAGINAVIPHDALKEANADIWRQLYEVNVIAPWTLIAEAERALAEASSPQQTSCVVNISSHAGVRPKGASIPYAASKAALNHMTKLLAKSLAPAIRVNAIAPGLVATPMTASWSDAHTLWRECSPMGRGAQPEEIAELAALLVSSTYITGEIVIADGGLNLT
jgi:NAD(P)-dependent dehydrogenase (short-subunit alcohol dehydrogenase family)